MIAAERRLINCSTPASKEPPRKLRSILWPRPKEPLRPTGQQDLEAALRFRLWEGSRKKASDQPSNKTWEFSDFVFWSGEDFRAGSQTVASAHVPHSPLSMSRKNYCKQESGQKPEKCDYKAEYYAVVGHVPQHEYQTCCQATLNSNHELDPVRKDRPLVDDEFN
jgi:hypothetical protein